MVETTSIKRMALALAEMDDFVGVEAVSLRTAECQFMICTIDEAYQKYPLDDWQLTFYSKTWARQTVIKCLLDSYHDLERKAEAADLELYSDYNRENNLNAELINKKVWEAVFHITNFLMKYTGRERNICRHEVLTNSISYSKIR